MPTDITHCSSSVNKRQAALVPYLQYVPSCTTVMQSGSTGTPFVLDDLLQYSRDNARVKIVNFRSAQERAKAFTATALASGL